ncbi:L-cystine transporter [Pseudomonadales bacterium]|jgi:L-cystine uptake protein TcyP (sodium:dicarboxylate symporter family)|nr:L-cystine transporter [Gammaproteobacteria bacterium]MBT3735555.1 L-cystine transporter [Gammaproteobacteria bacterium]MBT7540528.1 L-cystine transporter [Gammaproteobacteria bacterium]MDC1477891.1 L-cystine transporter [Pseudomonadales bacterium]|tara:strand:- start:3235 stop:4617 length:1383 start_codon:yes stop_codon:yes gene_type:complete
MSYTVMLNLAVFVGLIYGLMHLASRGFSLSQRVLASLVLGALLGLVFQMVYGADPVAIKETLAWSNIVGSGYVSLLKMIIMPLILVSMIAAVVKMDEISTLGKIGGTVVAILIGTTIISAVVGIAVANVFGLSADGLTNGARELARAEVLQSRQGVVTDLSFPKIILSFIPQNIFSDLAGARPTSIIAVVIFGILTGIAGLHVTRDEPEQGRKFREFMETAQSVVMKLVRLVINLTPYGVLSLMTKVTAGSSGSDILDLLSFIVASYVAIALMFVAHGLLLTGFGINTLTYFKRVWPVLTFAFTSRSSAATIPLNVETQIRDLKIHPTIANFSATFGATIGQNGCAGIYPAMLATMIAPTMGIDPLDPTFMVTLVGVVAISSFGIAGIGGGATFAALMVLPAMGLPVVLVALLISIEPLIDMARTALNVNGAMTAGSITNQVLQLDTSQDEASVAPTSQT